MQSLNYITKKLGRLGALYKSVLTRNQQSLLCSCRLYNNLSAIDVLGISSTTIKRILKFHKVQHEEGHACLLMDCPVCSEQTNSPKIIPKIYINKTTGYFSCHCCKHAGSWQILEKYFECKTTGNNVKDIFKDAFIIKDDKDNKYIVANSKPLNKCTEEILSTICDKFNLPIVPNPILHLLNARIDESLSVLYIPLLDMEGRTAGYRRIQLGTGDGCTETTIPSSNCTGTMVCRATRQSGSVAVVVPSVKDVLVLLEARVPGHVICLPYGLTSLPQTVLPSFEKFTKLVLWFGNDITAWDTARHFAKKFGEKRCYFVRPTDKQPLPHLAGEGQDLRAIASSAQPIWHKSITTFASLRQDVLSDLQNIDKVQGVKWTRFPTLCKILKGHRRGELTVITGPTGCGKTTFISEYSLDLAMQQVSTLWGSFEIRNARLARTMLQQMAGFTLDEHLDRFEQCADAFERLPIYFMTFHGQQSIKVVMEAVEHATYVHDIAHVIIDNVQFMIGMSDESRHNDRFWKQDAIVASFRSFATRNNCHVTLVIHPRKEKDADDLTTSSIFGGAKASQEADNVLIIQDKRLTSLRGKKYLQIAKNRYSGDLGVMAMDFDKSSLSYAQKKKKTEEKPTAEGMMEHS